MALSLILLLRTDWTMNTLNPTVVLQAFQSFCCGLLWLIRLLSPQNGYVFSPPCWFVYLFVRQLARCFKKNVSSHAHPNFDKETGVERAHLKLRTVFFVGFVNGGKWCVKSIVYERLQSSLDMVEVAFPWYNWSEMLVSFINISIFLKAVCF